MNRGLSYKQLLEIRQFRTHEIRVYKYTSEHAEILQMVHLQNQFRLLEANRIRDAERFDLQQREIDALRLQLKIEKDGRVSSANLAEELQADLARKADLLSLSNEELIEARERSRRLEKQVETNIANSFFVGLIVKL